MTDNTAFNQHMRKWRQSSGQGAARAAKTFGQSRIPEHGSAIDSLHRPLTWIQPLGNQAAIRSHSKPVLQAKLRIGQLNDDYEREADRVAEQVMSMPVAARPMKPG